MFHTILFSAWTILHLYIFWRASSIPLITRFVPPIFLAIIIAALWAAHFLPDLLGSMGMNSLVRFFDLFTMNWLGITFVIFTCLLIVDLITVFGFLLRAYAPLLRTAGLAAGILLSITALYQGFRAPVVTDYEIRLSGLPSEYDGLTLVALSDLHIGTFLDGNWLKDRVDQVNALNPDVVVFLGDLFEGDNPGERKKDMMRLFGNISAPLGVWGVTGNHESHGGLDPSVQFLEQAGVQMLRDRWAELKPGLVLAGVDERHNYRQPFDTAARIDKALEGRPLPSATILLSHRPLGAEKAAADGVGLMLSGHTHGGQLWPFTYISGMANPLLAGEYDIGGMPVIVSRGTGTWGPRMRLWHPGEILRITLWSK